MTATTGMTFDDVWYECDYGETNFRRVDIEWEDPDAPDWALRVKSKTVTPLPDIRSWGDLAAQHGKPYVDCRECGQRGVLGWDHRVEQRMRDRSVCFTCLFWLERTERVNDPAIAVVDGKFYTIAEEPSGDDRFRPGLGYGGRRFDIEFHDGRKVVSHNVWFGGEIPAHFRDRLPDNAKVTENEASSLTAMLAEIEAGSHSENRDSAGEESA